MANDGKKFDIEIGTSADTAGLEQVKRELEAVQQAGKEAANPMADGSQLAAGAERAAEGTRKVEEALQDTREAAADVADEVEKIGEKVGEVSEAADDAEPKFDKLINIQRAQVAAQIAQVLGQAATALRGMAANLGEVGKDNGRTLGNVATGLDAVSAAAGGAAQGFAVGGPFGAAVGGLIGLLSVPLKNAITGTIDDLKALKQSELDAAAAAKKYEEAVVEKSRRVRAEGLAAFFGAELAVLRSIGGEIERQNRLIASRRETERAQRSTANDAAVGAGADPVRVTANEQITRANEDIAASIKRVADARKLADGLAEEAALLDQKLKKIESDSGATRQAVEAAAAEAKKAQEAAKEAAADVPVTEQIEADTQERIRAELQQSFQGLERDVAAGITTEVTTAIGKVEAKAAEQGGKLSGLAGDSLQGLYDLVRDNIPDSAQLGRIETLMANFRSSSEGRDEKLIEGLDGVVAAIRKRDAEIDRLNGQIQDLNRRTPNF